MREPFLAQPVERRDNQGGISWNDCAHVNDQLIGERDAALWEHTDDRLLILGGQSELFFQPQSALGSFHGFREQDDA